MSGSVFGEHFKISTWGESHGKAIGVVIDGCPAGLELSETDIQPFMDRRKPGQSQFTTMRAESDTVEILSGVFEGRTEGTPISILLYNKDQHSADYSDIASYYRPGHADYTFDMKYGFRDYRGGGRSSGRETAGRVAAGAVASKLISELGISCRAYTKSIAEFEIYSFNEDQIFQNPLFMPDNETAAKASAYLEKIMSEKNSAGGVIECRIKGCPKGLGEPVFDKLSANLAKAVMSIGAVKGFEIGEGFNVSKMTGIEDNDAFYDNHGRIDKRTNHSGGMLGGISDGSDIIFRAAVKPTASIAAAQQTVTRDGHEIDISIKGRHDPVIVPRAVVVVESMAAVTIADALMANMTSRLSGMIDFYNR